MSLDYVSIPLNLTGLNLKSSEFTIQPGQLTELKNVWMDRTGEFRVRDGFTQLASADSSAIAVSDWHGDILRWSKTVVSRIITNTQNTNNIKFYSGKYTTYDVGGEVDGTQDEFSYAEGPNYGVFAKVTRDYSVTPVTDIIELQFCDLVSKKVFFSERLAGTRVGLVATSTGVGVVRLAGTDIKFDHYITFDGAGVPAKAISNVTLKAIGNPPAALDLCHIDGYVAVVYTEPNIATEVRVQTINLSTSAVADFQMSTNLATLCSICRTSATTGAILWWDQANFVLRYREFSVPNTPGGAAVVVRDWAALSYDPSHISIAYDGANYHITSSWDAFAPVSGTYGSAFYGPRQVTYFRMAGGSITTTQYDYHVAAVSRLLLCGSSVYQYHCAYYESNDTANVALSVRAYNRAAVGRYFDLVFSGRTRFMPDKTIFPHVAYNATDLSFVVALPYSGTLRTQAKIVKREEVGKPIFRYWNGVLINNVTPHLSAYDGRELFPAGFATWPRILTVVKSSGVGLSTGTYGYSAIWERIDAAGNIWRSAPSLVRSVAVSGSDLRATLTIAFPPFFDSSRDDYRLVLYRTQANGATFQRLVDLDPYVLSADGIFTYVDAAADTSIVSNPFIYTDGGIIENTLSPIVETFTVARDRVWVISADDSDVYPSKLRISGEGIGSTDAFRISINGPKDLRAIGAMDDKVLVFGEESTTLLYGQGPDDLGQGYFEQNLVSDELGCVEPRSVTLADDGLYFLSKRSLWKYGRGMDSQGVGIPVDTYKDLTFIGGSSNNDRLFTIWPTTSGTMLVWDDYHKIWSRFVTTALKGFCVVGGRFVILTTTGAVWREDRTTYQDNAASFECQIKTGWVSFNGIQGFVKVRKLAVLGKSQTAAFNLVATLAYDFVDTTAETITVANATVKPAGYAYQWEAKPKRQKCESMRLALTWTAASSGVSIVNVSFEVGGLPGLARRLIGAKRVGGV